MTRTVRLVRRLLRVARVLGRRRARLYCVGTAKSGTHSVAEMFDRSVRSWHEPDGNDVIDVVLQASRGELTPSDIRHYLKQRDRRLRLDVDSSQLNYWLLGDLLKLFPDARFVLTIRDCYSWLDSFLNDSLRRSTTGAWLRLRDHRFRPDLHRHPPEERVLEHRGLYTLDGYLGYWADHNSTVLESVPADRLLVVRTDDLSASARQIAAFAGIPHSSTIAERTHAFRNPTKFGLLREIDTDHLEQKVRQHCGPLMERFFPDIARLDDAPI